HAKAAKDSTNDAAADTGWVEIGGSGAFGSDDPFADLPTAEDEQGNAPHGGQIPPYLSYERVHQFVPGIDQRYAPKSGWLPGFRTRVARAMERNNGPGVTDGEWLYDLRLEQPFDARRRGRVAVSVYRHTDDDGFGQVGDVENALAALFFHD